MGCLQSNGANPQSCKAVQDDVKEDENVPDIHKKYQFRRTFGKGASYRVVRAIDKSDSH